MAGANILWVFDEEAGDLEPALVAIRNSDPVGTVTMCPIGVDQAVVDRHAKGLSERAIAVEVLPFTRIFHETAFAERDPYIAFISDFSEDNSLREYFKFADKSGSKENTAWWLSLIAEKNPMKTESINKMMKCLAVISLLDRYAGKTVAEAAAGRPGQRFCALIEMSDRQSTVALLSYCAEKGIDLRDVYAGRADGAGPAVDSGPAVHTARPSATAPRAPAKPSVLSHFAGAARAIKSTLGRASMIKRTAGGPAGGLQAPTAPAFTMITYFPLLDHGDLGRGKFTNLYYGPLQRALDEKKIPYSWLAMMLGFEELTLDQSLELGEKVRRTGDSISFVESWFGPGDAVAVSLRFLRLSLRFLFKRRTIAPKFRHPSTGLPLWDIFSDDWYASFCGRTLMEGLIYHRIFENALAWLPRGTTVTYMAEMHGWENALNMAARSRGGLKLVGIQHTIVPKMLLNYFYDRRDLDPRRTLPLPRPHALGCVGNVTRQLFLDYGWEVNRLFVLGAIRALHYRQQIGEHRSWADRENKIVIALTISASEGRQVLNFCYQALKDIEGIDGVKVLVKGHPACPAAPLIASLGSSGASQLFEVTKTPLGELLPTAKALIVTESSSTLEGIACGCPVVVPLLADSVDMNPLTGISDLPARVASPEEMAMSVRNILAGSVSPLDHRACRILIDEYCDFPSSSAEFLLRVQTSDG